MLKLNKIIEKTAVEGPGNRFCIWVQGCPHQCKGCFNTETWDKSKGFDCNPELLIKKILSVDNIDGVTFLGGEPFEQAEDLSYVAEIAKNNGLGVLTFTGYTYEQLKLKHSKSVDKLIEYTDLLIDGRFKEELLDYSRPWVGSSNQRYIFLSERYTKEEIFKYNNSVEIRIGNNGEIIISGMGNFSRIKELFYKKGDKGND